MNPKAIVSKSDNLNSLHIGWRYYNSIKKKAMEQEFSWSGLVISLSIAFFIVIISSFSLNILKDTMIQAGIGGDRSQKKIYRLENLDTYSMKNYLQAEIIGYSKLRNISYPSIA